MPSHLHSIEDLHNLIDHLKENDLYSPSCCSCRRLPLSKDELLDQCQRLKNYQQLLRLSYGEFFHREATMFVLHGKEFPYCVNYYWRDWYFSMDFKSFWLALWCIIVFQVKGQI